MGTTEDMVDAITTNGDVGFGAMSSIGTEWTWASDTQYQYTGADASSYVSLYSDFTCMFSRNYATDGSALDNLVIDTEMSFAVGAYQWASDTDGTAAADYKSPKQSALYTYTV